MSIGFHFMLWIALPAYIALSLWAWARYTEGR